MFKVCLLMSLSFMIGPQFLESLVAIFLVNQMLRAQYSKEMCL